MQRFSKTAGIFRAIALVAIIALAALCGCTAAPKQVIVATSCGEKITQARVEAVLNTYLASDYHMTPQQYISQGGDWNALVRATVEQMVLRNVIEKKADELGIPGVTEEEAAKARAFVDQEMAALRAQEEKEYRRKHNNVNEGALAKALDKAERDYFINLGFTREQYEDQYARQLLSDRVKAQLCTGEVKAEDIRAYYDENLARQMSGEDADPALRLYYQDGYKLVQMIFVKFSDEVQQEGAQMYNENRNKPLNTLLEDETARRKEDIDAIRAAIATGEDFDALIKRYSEEPEDQRSPGSSLFVTSDQKYLKPFRKALDTLGQAGDVAECATYLGYYFIKATGVESGPAAVPYEAVFETIGVSFATAKQADEWQKLTAGWLADAIASGDVSIDVSPMMQG